MTDSLLTEKTVRKVMEYMGYSESNIRWVLGDMDLKPEPKPKPKPHLRLVN